MTSKLLTLTAAAHLLAAVALVPAAWAQSGTDSTGSGDAGTASGITDPNDETRAGDNNADFGQDWSTSLGAAIFSDNTMTTVRPADELSSQWTTLSAEDREILRRDCTAFRADAAAGTGGAATGGTADTTAGATAGATAGSTAGSTAGASSATRMQVGADQMQVICTTVDTLQ